MHVLKQNDTHVLLIIIISIIIIINDIYIAQIQKFSKFAISS